MSESLIGAVIGAGGRSIVEIQQYSGTTVQVTIVALLIATFQLLFRGYILLKLFFKFFLILFQLLITRQIN